MICARSAITRWRHQATARCAAAVDIQSAPKSLIDYARVEVQWVDAHSGSRAPLEACRSALPVEQRTLGYLLVQEDTHLVVVNDGPVTGPDSPDYSFTCIPQGCVVRVIQLLEKE